MNKWYDSSETDENIVISSRIRLARNIKKYPFSQKLSEEQALKLIEEVKASIKNANTYFGDSFDFININEKSNAEKYSLLENHSISHDLMDKDKPAGVLIKDDETISIMINEEDHIRIQTVFPGYNIEKAWDIADKIDNLIEENIDYAFDENYGYLTSCITNVGTGMRASFMIHIPLIEMFGHVENLSQAISKFGMTLRGIYGEGSEPLGGIYQISNQVTLGKSEKEIIEALKNVTNQIIEQEKELGNSLLKERKTELEDRVFRSYGILSNCRKISSKEAMKLLSDLRFGIITGMLNLKNKDINIYSIMMNIQPGNLIKYMNKSGNPDERDIQRASYIRERLGNA
ncbi:MAG: protein arginine kinase [Clostridiales bacterium]|nr:protein arginine kinase [Clostridiales bacterium]